MKTVRVSWKRLALKRTKDEREKQMWKLRKQDKHWQKMGKNESEYNE